MNHTQENGTALPDQVMALQQQAQEQIEAAKEAIGDLDKKVRAFVRENPGMCLVGAVAAGFIVARLVSRRW